MELEQMIRRETGEREWKLPAFVINRIVSFKERNLFLAKFYRLSFLFSCKIDVDGALV
jgi:hypothetical protein